MWITTTKTLTVDGQTFARKEISFPSTAPPALVYAGQLPTAAVRDRLRPASTVEKSLDPKASEKFTACMRNSDELVLESYPHVQVRTNADNTGANRANAIAFGATGIGLTRTEHMFFEGDRIDAMREMILADSRLKTGRTRSPNSLPVPEGKISWASSRHSRVIPATIRFLDPPLHEFLPHSKDASHEQTCSRSWECRWIKSCQRVKELHEFNPMLGLPRLPSRHQVCGEISEMQARAVFEAAAEVNKKAGIKVKPEVMIPLVGFKKELDLQVEVVHRSGQGSHDRAEGEACNYQRRHHD